MQAINFMDVSQRASVTALGNGVMFRMPTQDAGVMLLASLGYPSDPPRIVSDINLSSLRLVADSMDFFGYRGCDLDYHYFSLPHADGVRLPRAELDLQRMPIQLGFCLFVTFRNTRLTIADPATMSRVAPETCQWALAW